MSDSAMSAPWVVLVVDDDPAVHSVTRLALADFTFEGRSAELLEAASAEAARGILARRKDVALILLDVVMETEHAGLDLVRHIRDDLRNRAVRIVLRTAQPGQAPPEEVTERYEIDDYRSKTELTYERLKVLVKAALRTHRVIHDLAVTNEALEQFNDLASHDMKTPLRGIAGSAELLMRRCAGKLEERDRELLGFVAQGARTLQHLIDDLLAYSSLTRAPATRQLVELGQVIATATKNLQHVIDERGALVRVSKLPSVDGNPVQLERLFRNLIENALKFQPGSAPVVEISSASTDDGWEIFVRDQGIGIEPEHLEDVFVAFHRLQPAERFPGSGLGLSICQRIATLHGGTLRAESEPGAGTTLILKLPRKDTGERS